jgi:hypothetical protein
VQHHPSPHDARASCELPQESCKWWCHIVVGKSIRLGTANISYIPYSRCVNLTFRAAERADMPCTSLTSSVPEASTHLRFQVAQDAPTAPSVSPLNIQRAHCLQSRRTLAQLKDCRQLGRGGNMRDGNK